MDRQIQRSTLQIGGEEDHLRKGDILFNINGEELAYKNKFDLVSKLSSLGGIAEVSVLRKITPNCFGSTNPEQHVPYHNGIFAQNSIKLAMRKYEKPSMKSSSEVDFGTLQGGAPTHLAAASSSAVAIPKAQNDQDDHDDDVAANLLNTNGPLKDLVGEKSSTLSDECNEKGGSCDDHVRHDQPKEKGNWLSQNCSIIFQ